MNTHKKTLLSTLISTALLACLSTTVSAYTEKYRLSWTDDPATTMMVGWRQLNPLFATNLRVEYRVKGSLSSWASNTTVTTRNFENTVHGTSDILNNSFVKLTGLTPDTDYEFRVCDSDGCSQTYMWFRTAPNSGETISFIAGGDSRRESSGNFGPNDQARRDGFELVSKMRPLFVLFSGDYMNDGTFDEWTTWLDEWQLTRSSDGRMYPIVPSHGNHENDETDMVRDLFNTEDPSGYGYEGTYGALSFGGNMMRIWTLNTELEPASACDTDGVGYSTVGANTSQAIWDDQTNWFTADLAANTAVNWKVVNYHRPLRPHTSGKDEGCQRYDDWAPLMDTYDIDLSIDSDSHMVKYTVPVKASTAGGNDEGFIASDFANGEHGTVFIGEGSWGAPKRPIDDAKSWTIANNSFWQFKHIVVSPTNMDIRTVRFEPSSYPNGVDADVTELTQAAQDAAPESLPAGIDLWAPFVGDGPLSLPFPTSVPAIKADAEDVPDDGTNVSAPDGAIYWHDFSTGFTNATYGDIETVDQGCNGDTSTDNWYIFGSSNPKASINGYYPSNPDQICIDWMILPPQDLTSSTAITLNFDSDYNYGGPELELYWSSDYDPNIHTDPSTATWTQLTFNLPATDGYTVYPSGNVVVQKSDISVGEEDTLYFAFYHETTGRESNEGRIWEVDNIAMFDGEMLDPPETTEDFNDATLGSWQGVSFSSTGDWRASTVDGQQAGFIDNKSAFANADDWLVSPAFAIDASGANAKFNFDYHYSGATAQVPATDNLQMLINSSCTLSGTYTTTDINSGSWTLIEDTWSGTEGSWTTYPEIDLSAYNGQTICLAFRYRDAGFFTAREWAVDNLVLGEPVVVASDTIPPLDAAADLRIAAFNTLLADRGAGALITDLATGSDSQAQGLAEIIQRVAPDVILLNEFDFDAGEIAINSFKSQYLEVSQNGATPITYPYHYVNISNTGVQPETEGDPDCDFNDPAFGCDAGSANDDPEDAYGFGNYSGAFGMAILSKYPIDTANIRTFRKFLWKDMPGALLDDLANNNFYQPDEVAIFRLSSKSHWDVPVTVGGETIHVLASHPTPPVFDDVEDRNGRRNHDEIRFWEDYVSLTGSDCYIYDDANVSGCLGYGKRFVIMGDQNADPVNGDSFGTAINQFLNNPAIDDSFPQSSSGGIGLSSGEFATADFGLRADYVLPSEAGLNVEMSSCEPEDPALSCGIFWPRVGDPLRALTGSCSGSGPSCDSSDHRMVWLDLSIVADADADGVADDVDNCTGTANTAQTDLDKDGSGTPCDVDDDGDLMDDDWEALYGLNTADPTDANGDLDGDGDTNLEEFNNGTNPTVDESAVSVPLLPFWALFALTITLLTVNRKRQ